MKFFFLIKRIIKKVFLFAIPMLTMIIMIHQKNYILEEIKNPYNWKENQLEKILSEIKKNEKNSDLSIKNLKIFYYKIEKKKIILVSNLIDLNKEINFINPNYFNDSNKKLNLSLMNQVIPIIFEKLKTTPSQFIHTSIPKETKLLSYEIKKNLLSLNFNENFLNDSYGELGKKIKIAQIINSFSQIKNIKFIEFKIETQFPKYLDRDGLIVNKIFSTFPINQSWNI